MCLTVGPCCLDQAASPADGEIQLIGPTSSKIVLEPAGLPTVSSLGAGRLDAKVTWISYGFSKPLFQVSPGYLKNVFE